MLKRRREDPMTGNSCGRRRLGIGPLLLVVAALAMFAAGCGGSSSSSSEGGKKREKSSEDGPVVQGTWAGGCNQYSAGDYSACKAIKVSGVRCQWKGDKVWVNVVFKNTFGAHVTVHFNPLYVLKNAGLHGDGLLASQDVGLDPGEKRDYGTDQDPKGVSGQPKITKCAPKIDTIQGVELG
jgi:hypothetical protein